MLPPLKRALESVGLNDNEVSVMLVLLERGPMFAAALAKAAKVNRSTTYGVLNLLSEKGLVSQIKQDGADRWQSIEPELLPAYIERKGKELLEEKCRVEAVLPQLSLLRSKGKSLPKVRFYEGVEGVKQAYEDTLENNQEKLLKDISGVDAAFERLGEDWVKYYLQKRAKLGIACIDLAPESGWARKSRSDDEKYLRTTKFIPAQYGFDAELALYDNKVGIFSYSQENPIALIIEDDTVSDMMKKLFDCLETVAK